MRDGVLVLEEKQSYEGRLKMSNYQIILEDFQIPDVGSYHVHDPQGNLAYTIEVDILCEFLFPHYFVVNNYSIWSKPYDTNAYQ